MKDRDWEQNDEGEGEDRDEVRPDVRYGGRGQGPVRGRGGYVQRTADWIPQLISSSGVLLSYHKELNSRMENAGERRYLRRG